ncbi:twin-arginine translocase TatA/TatE family subunit [Bergeyella zoohelcum]|uniref:Sec-independent protein translocase protein TatA n=2 Tax=Bergeyella zoohelcum TaxID=1015 RepID=K1LLJ1_9FLAO|nr:twin-arginine translocase TatA/TatE family subunit [Bergeyella zoohelcum]EKB55501.1 TatA/E family twin arginine-targeting protein translocase [Bergeyella zoohelcum ATCC 43767]EKB60289.1 TatA/E family twin arginine-targeting protein translocase [Bergeyella zoohelcum CCUG 30536]MDY6026562.1 twin-arginine translocase TatA/TatE family subunit [Bergeyella zoohelcum]SUV50106.1 Sec-independent protein translocase protein TatA [Bergeyella zoohelcum]SUV53030.1 Sec-independent protein translocase pro
MGGIGFREILLLLLIIVILFGAKKIPELMRGMGSGIKEFKDAVKEDKKETSERESTNNPS